MLTRDHLHYGRDEHGVRIRIFTAALMDDHVARGNVGAFRYQGEEIAVAGSSRPLRHGLGETSQMGHLFRYRYRGQWHMDKRHGTGTYVYACGDVYKGEWADGKYSGRGTYTSSSG